MDGKDSHVAACVQPGGNGLSIIRNIESLASHGLRESVAAWRIISKVYRQKNRVQGKGKFVARYAGDSGRGRWQKRPSLGPEAVHLGKFSASAGSGYGVTRRGRRWRRGGTSH